MRIPRRLALPLLTAAVGLAPAYGDLVTYTDKASFLTAMGAGTTIDFSGIAPAGGFVQFEDVPDQLTVDSVNFQGFYDICPFSCVSVPYLFVADQAFAGGAYNYGVPAILAGPDLEPSGSSKDPEHENARIDIVLPPDVFAFGLDLGL